MAVFKEELKDFEALMCSRNNLTYDLTACTQSGVIPDTPVIREKIRAIFKDLPDKLAFTQGLERVMKARIQFEVGGPFVILEVRWHSRRREFKLIEHMNVEK